MKQRFKIDLGKKKPIRKIHYMQAWAVLTKRGNFIAVGETKKEAREHRVFECDKVVPCTITFEEEI